MNGFNNLLNSSEQINTFFSSGTWQTWHKPQGAKNIYIFCLGGGGGGQAGTSGTSNTSRAGGTSGSASGYSFGTFSCNVLPDILYINVGAGGAGGTGSGGNGAAGALSYVSVLPNTTTQNIVLRSGNAAAGATNGSTNTPSAGTVWTYTSGYLVPFLGTVSTSAGVNGIPAGTSGTVGLSVTISNIVSPGATGAWAFTSAYRGGSINGSGFFNGVPSTNITASSAPDGFNCLTHFENILTNRNFLFFTGGAGGTSSNTGTGGNGGNGSYGCGGGGGGAGVTGGKGGNGGNGLVIIVAW